MQGEVQRVEEERGRLQARIVKLQKERKMGALVVFWITGCFCWMAACNKSACIVVVGLLVVPG